jgi:hypothetical protein
MSRGRLGAFGSLGMLCVLGGIGLVRLCFSSGHNNFLDGYNNTSSGKFFVAVEAITISRIINTQKNTQKILGA